MIILIMKMCVTCYVITCGTVTVFYVVQYVVGSGIHHDGINRRTPLPRSLAANVQNQTHVLDPVCEQLHGKCIPPQL